MQANIEKLIVANWKSNKTPTEAVDWCKKYFQALPELSPRLLVTIAVPFPALQAVSDYLARTEISSKQFSLAVQDISSYPAGSYTGAVSVQNLVGLGVRYAIVGHSERRKYFAETNQSVAQKCSLLLDLDITPVVCVEADNVADQAAALDDAARSKVVVAFDPISAISSYSNAGAKSGNEVKTVLEDVKKHFAEKMAIYGGSVNDENVAQYSLMTDGVLVGRASLDPQQFARLTTNAWVEPQV